MNIYVPSRSRYGLTDQRPVDVMPDAWRRRVTYVVPAAQHGDYLRWMRGTSRFDGVDLRSCPEDGIAGTRRWIAEVARACGEASFAMIDDDLTNFFVRVSPTDWRLRKQTPDDFTHMMTAVEMLLSRSGGYAHVGVSAREGNNRAAPGAAPLAEDATRTLRFLCYRTEPFLACHHGRVPVMEDFDVNLQLLRAGHRTCDLKYWAQNQRQTGSPGGCADYRDLALQDAAARRLAELHPAYVRLRTKRDKVERPGGMSERTEVTIGWKKAAADGLAARGG